MKKIILPVMLILIGFALFTGQNFDEKKWSIDPRMTMIYPTDEYVPLPQVDNYVHPNTSNMVYYTPMGVLTVGPNFRVYPSATTQSEVPISRHPTNQNIMFASSNAVSFSPFFISEGVYVTTDGGVSWFGSDTTKTTPLSGHGGDPAPAIAPNGYFHQSFLGGGMNAAYSTNNGLSWSTIYKITTGSQDKNHTFINDVSSSPYYGRVYVTWSLFTASLPPAVVSYSTNNGVSYSSVINVSTPLSGHYCQGVNGAIAPNGDAYICWGNPIAGSPYTGDYIGFAKSTNGGANWTGSNNVYDCNDIRGTLPTKENIRVNGFPWMGVDRTGGPRAGWIYIVTGEKNLAPAGSDPDIIMHRSSDNGTTWSAGIRVNQDPLNNGKIQFFPCIRVDEGGGVNIVYYDDRNTSSDSSEVYVSRSTDGGNTWTDILVSDHRFKPKPISGLAGGYQGDYIGITSGNNKVWPYWCSDASGIYQAWITSVDLGTPSTHDYAVGPFIDFPSQFTINTTYHIKAKVTNLGTSPETNVRVRFKINGVGGMYYDISLPAGGADTVDFTWIPTTVGSYNLAVFSELGTDQNRANDTVKATVNVTNIIHDYSVGPFIDFPEIFIKNNSYHIKAKVTNLGNFPETNVRVSFKINGVGGMYYNISLPAGGADTVDFTWVPNTAGDFNLAIFSALAGDVNRANDTVKANVRVYSAPAVTIFCDDFSGGPTNWTITNNGGTCVWQTFSTPYPNAYTLPPASTGAVFSADADECGSGTTLLSTATIIENVDCSLKENVYLEFDNDWNAIDAQDSAIVEVSYNGGSTWSALVAWGGTDVRNSHETYALPGAEDNPTVRVRFRSIQPGWDWWWTVDNVCIKGFPMTGLTQNSGQIPTEYDLLQNYPNPFNPTTQIKFDIPKQGFVSLKVYDVLGKEVANLVNEVKAAGSYAVEFNGANLSSGIYYYRIESGSFVNVKKMVLIK